MWLSWLATMCLLLTWSHLGRCWIVPTSWTTSTLLRSSRLEKQRRHVKKVQFRVQLKAMLFASLIQSCNGMQEGQGGQPGEQAFLQQMTSLATAATNAANAAERAIGLLSSANGPSSSSAGSACGGQDGGGLQAAARILKNPESFSGEDPLSFVSWKFAFCSWLSFGDGRFQKCFENLEKLSPEEDVPAYSDIEQELSVKLFAILASYLKGKCFSLVKSFCKSRDGFKLWRALIAEFEPSTRQRSLALAQTLSNYPAFVNSKSTMHGADPELRDAWQRLREYLQLTITDRTTYGQLKETMLSYDKACKSWIPEAVLKSLQSSTATTSDYQGAQPMEVDRIENKGKGKKGKSKDKGKSWWNYGSVGTAFGRGRGRGKGGRTNKGKGKGKQKGKGKSKGKFGGKKGKNKGKVDSQQCRICWEYGHWARECPNRMVQQVINDGQGQGQGQVQGQVHQNAGQAQTPIRPSPHSSYPPSTTTASTVRRIFSIPMGIPSLTSSSSGSVHMISFGDVQNEDVVILDSGSDVSLLPLSFGHCGVDAEHPEEVQLCDCQGSHLEVTGDGPEAELEHAFLIANVKSCILSLGQLYQSGWSVKLMDDGSGLFLESPDQELHVPVFYQRNSLALRATVCRVQQVDDESMPDSHACVRAIVELEDKFRPEVPQHNQWQVVDGNPFMRCIGTHFVDPRPTWAGNFGYRTTLFQRRSLAEEDHGFHGWHVVEVSSKYLELEDPSGPIPDLAGYAQDEDVVILTILSEREEVLSRFGGLLDAGGYFMDEPYEAESPFRGEHDPSDVPVEGLEIQPVLDEGHDDQIMGRESPEHQALAPALREDAVAEAIEVNDIRITPTSAVETLRAAGRFLGVSTGGSKRKIYDRIRAAHVHSLRLRALEVARGEYEAMQPHPQFQDAPAQPTMRERKLHEVTHIPFKKWCSVCVQAKSRSNHQRATPPDEMSQRSYPTLQCDFYTVMGNLNVLILVDAWTKYVGVEPLRNKLQSVVGGSVARFLGELGYFDTVELSFDSEPVLAAGMSGTDDSCSPRSSHDTSTFPDVSQRKDSPGRT
eukprot:s2422_g6.t1